MEDDEIARDLLFVDAQVAYVRQREGRLDEAIIDYQNILKLKPDDATVAATVGNNLAVAQ